MKKAYYTNTFLKSVAVLLALSLFVLLPSCTKKYNEYSSFAMGSMVTGKIYGDEETADETWNSITEQINKADSLLSLTNEDSDISKLSKIGKVNADEYTVDIMTKAVTLCNICGKAIDITLGAVTELWGFSSDEPSLPEDDEIRSALETKNLESILIDEENNTVIAGKGQVIDLGAFGKGAACDAALPVLRKQNSAAVITVGGTVLLFGENPEGASWSVGIRNPFGSANDYFATLTIDNETADDAVFVSTSGSYEKTFEANGKTYHHILDPETGYPVDNGLVSVTVISDSGMNSDALSTACFVNGADSTSLEWLGYFSAEAVFVFEDGTVYATDGIKENLCILSEGFSLTDTL